MTPASPTHRRPRRWLRFVLAVFTAPTLAAIGLLATQESPHFQLLGRLVSEVPTEKHIVALTFDDGPNPPFTGRVLDVLRARGAKATFFVLGCNAETTPQDLARIVREGHEIGNHGYWHSSMTFKLPRVIESDLQRTDRLIRQAGWTGPIHVRAPYGRKLLVAPWIFYRQGRTHVMWSVSPNPSEFETDSAQAIAASILAQIRPGAIVLLHDGGGDRTATLEALGMVLDELARQGFASVTVSELMKQSVPPIVTSR